MATMKHRLVVWLLILLATAGALMLRLPNLDRRPMHLDEAIHTIKCDTLWQTGEYVYDPDEYHGPTLYYLTLPVLGLSSSHTFAESQAWMYRLVPVLAGTVLVLLLLLMRDGLGRAATVCAAILTAISPAMVYYSRYYIQEMLLVCFTMAATVCFWRYVRDRRWGWAIAGGIALGLMHATKETCVITYGVIVAALLINIVWHHRLRGLPVVWRGYIGRFAMIGGLLGAIVVSLLLYSAFFTNAAGPLDSIRTYTNYFDRAGNHGVHDHPWHYYLWLLTCARFGHGPIWSEAFILVLALVGIIAAYRGRGVRDGYVPLLRYLANYTILLAIVYSVIPYKTPWCMLSFLHGLILLAGVGAVALWQWSRRAIPRTIVVALLLAGSVHLGWQAWRATSPRFECSNYNPYVYAHTVRDVENLTAWVERIAAVAPQGHDVLIKVIVPAADYWPLPWYLRSFSRVGYWEKLPTDPTAPIVITAPALVEDVQAAAAEDYQTAIYGVRPDVKLVVCVEPALYQRWLATQLDEANDE